MEVQWAGVELVHDAEYGGGDGAAARGWGGDQSQTLLLQLQQRIGLKTTVLI
jgi:hypothetical protein